ncbi:MAG TPA: AAA family ATPase [Anaeromyxobacteraceae bacterium]|nr:AAA family ATPase [Anaeromyxobacteraceae bacterium]
MSPGSLGPLQSIPTDMGAPARATAPIQVLVLGDIGVSSGGRLVPLPPSRKTRALLGFLALSGRAQTRQRLCDLFWDGPGDPRAALRWSLTKLRPLVDGGRRRLSTEKELVELRLEPGELDLAAARRLLGRGTESATAEDLRLAAALFRGELLEGLDLADCFAFHEWCVAQREAARRLRLEILDALVGKLDGDPEEALGYARARVAVDPFAEAGHLAVVRLLGRLRRGREGLEQYDACRQILAGVGARPSPEMEQVRLALTAAPRPAGPEAVPPRAVAATPTAARLVGRRREGTAVAEVVAAVAATRRRHALLVLGEPGIGKSLLLDEVARQAAAARFLVLRGRSFEAESLRPYGPWIDALREAPLAALPDARRAELAPLLPELGAADPANDQLRLFEAVAGALQALAAEAPVVVALDDLHWLDAASAALLHYAFRSLEGAPVLIAGAARPGELADNLAALKATRSIGRAERVLRLELEPLGAEEVAELARSVAPSVDVARVYAESEGNPLYALLVARALRGGAGEWRSVDSLLEDRLASVAGAAREVIAWAAALGRGFRADLLARVSGLATPDLVAALADLERHGLVRPSGDAGWDFAHDLFRRFAYAAVSQPRRQLLHREIARALAPLPDPDGALADEIARHAALGDDAELAAQAAVAAGTRAVRLAAIAEAKDVAERGLRFAARLPAKRRIALSLGLLRVLVDASRHAGGDPALAERLEALIEEARREDLPAEVAAGYAILSHAHYANRDLSQTAAATEDGVAALRQVAPADAAVAMAETGGCLAILERDIPRARMLLAEARRWGDLSGRAAVYLETGTGIIRHLEGADDEAAAFLERALRMAPEGAPWEECVILARLAFIDLERGRPEQVAARTQRMRVAAPRLGEAGVPLLADALDVAARRAAGERVGDDEIDAVLSRLEADARVHFARLACVLAEADIAAGRHSLARGRLERACAAAGMMGRSSVVVLARALLARCDLSSGDRAAALGHVDAARRELGLGVPMARATALLDEVAGALGSRATPLASPPPA